MREIICMADCSDVVCPFNRDYDPNATVDRDRPECMMPAWDAWRVLMELPKAVTASSAR